MRKQENKTKVLKGLIEAKSADQFKDNETVIRLLDMAYDFIDRDIFTIDDLIALLELSQAKECETV